MVYLLKGGRNLVGYDVTLANIPGALKFVTSIPEKYGLNIVYLEACGISEESGRFFIAIDLKDGSITSEELLKEFRGNRNFVISINISPTLEDIIFPSRFCIKDLGGLRAILLSLANMKGIILGIKKEMGSVGDTFLYHLGHNVGEEIYRMYAEPRKINDVIKGVLLLEALARGAGWGDVTEYEKLNDKIIIRFEQLWECEIQKNITDKPASNYVRGILTGFFKSLLRREISVEETKCIAKGDQYCQFEMTLK